MAAATAALPRNEFEAETAQFALAVYWRTSRQSGTQMSDYVIKMQ